MPQPGANTISLEFPTGKKRIPERAMGLLADQDA